MSKETDGAEKRLWEIPRVFEGLFSPRRYKIYYGGRGGGKSHSIAKALLALGMKSPERILCTREIQKSITDSVHKLLADIIRSDGLDGFYTVQTTSIRGINGTEFLFSGLRHNISSLKSFEGCTYCWVEEAQAVSAASWDILIPTIRKEGSEIWVSFNPDLEDDPTYQRFVVSPPTGARVVKVGYLDNPWFPGVLEQERIDLLARDPIAYKNVWDGECKQAVEGAIFASELTKAAEEKRITRVPVQEGVPVQTYWDLGQSDNTAIWFVQLVGMEYRMVDYYQNNGQKMPHYIEVLARRGYLYGDHCLPHDAAHDQIAAEKSIRDQMKDACRNNPLLGKPENVKIVERTPQKANAINSARTIFARCVFDKDKTADGLQCLRRYRYAVDLETGKIGKQPAHDMWSHGCLVAGSLVATDRGYVPIEGVRIGDAVWTPAGYAKVLNAGPTKMADVLHEIITADGCALTCTPEHKILTQRGFIRADALLYSDHIYSGRELSCKLSTLISMVIGSGFRETITGRINGHSRGRVICIERFGNTIMAQYQMITKYITKMATRLTTILETSKYSTAPNISDSIHWNVMREGNCLHRQNIVESAQQNGISQTRAVSGIRSMERKHGLIVRGLSAVAMSVGRSLCHLILHAPVGATRVVHLRIRDAAMEKMWVYDLTVEKHACYQANGLLVSNSDAFLAVGQYAKPPMKKEPVKYNLSYVR